MLESIANALWQPWLLGLFLAVGLRCSVSGKFFPLWGVKRWLKDSFGCLLRDKQARQKGLTQVQTLCTALASTIGTGSVAGVATAVFFGGPGAVFWMWISALLGMSTSFVEKTLAVKYRAYGPEGPYGGPMVYLGKRLGWNYAAKGFALWCVLASLSGGALVQSSSISAAVSAAWGWDRAWVGCVTALGVGLVIWGGIQRVGRLSERLVPLMALLYLVSGLAVILAYRENLLPVLKQILTCAISPKAVVGGTGGYTLAGAMRYGIARGVFTNEAGVGSSAIAHASANTESPVREGFWGIFETFFATGVVCTITALCLLLSGAYDPEQAFIAMQSGTVTESMTGAPLVGRAFAAVFGDWGPPLVSVCLLLFAFTSLLGWNCYGERGLAYLLGNQSGRTFFRIVFPLTVWAGSIGEVGPVWALSDICNGLMALPNLLALAVLAPETWRDLNRPHES